MRDRDDGERAGGLSQPAGSTTHASRTPLRTLCSHAQAAHVISSPAWLSASAVLHSSGQTAFTQASRGGPAQHRPGGVTCGCLILVGPYALGQWARFRPRGRRCCGSASKPRGRAGRATGGEANCRPRRCRGGGNGNGPVRGSFAGEEGPHVGRRPASKKWPKLRGGRIRPVCSCAGDIVSK